MRRAPVSSPAHGGITRAQANHCKEATRMPDIGPPLGLIAVGLILWLAVHATLAGISIQTIGLILAVVGVAWVVLQLGAGPTRLVQGRTGRAQVVRERPVVRERDVY